MSDAPTEEENDDESITLVVDDGVIGASSEVLDPSDE